MNAPTIRIETDPRVEPTTDSLTILFAEAGESAAPLKHEQIAAIDRYNGCLSKKLGNSIMAEFADAESAVRAAIEMQRLTREANRELLPEQPSSLRIGIHTAAGAPGITLFGATVNLAAAITTQATAEQILISKPVFEAISQESDLRSAWSGTLSSEERSEEQDVFEVQWTEAPAGIPPRYEVLSQVGAGGMGVVYKVRDLETGEIVALKILKAEVASDPAMQENLRREVCLSRKVTHKNVCRIHEFGRAEGVAFISMEFVDGESLLAQLRRAGSLPWPEALGIARQICAGLREAHLEGIVHRDLKPANIMLCRGNGAVKLMDFGIARSFQNTAHVTCAMVGTPAYMAPEQVQFNAADARTDIYSLGLVLYEMVTGTRAFDGDTPIAVAMKHLQESPKRPREVAAGLPAYADAVVLKCLEKDPANRFASVDELLAALECEPRTAPAASIWADFVTDMRATYVDVKGATAQWMSRALASLRSIDWNALRANRNPKTIALGAGLALAIGGIGVFALHGAHKTRTIALVNPASASSMQNASAITKAPTTENDAATPQEPTAAKFADGARPISSYAINLTGDPGRTVAVAPVIVSSDAGSSAVKTKPSKPQAKREAGAKISSTAGASHSAASHTASAIAAESAGNALVAADSAQPSELQLQSSTPQQTAALDGSNTSLFSSTSGSTSEAAASASDDNAAQPYATPRYFEVGTFKDSTWADQAVQKLTELGFRAQSIQKVVLWVHSYQVRVGPFSNSKSMSEAAIRLTEHGFRPRAIK